MLGVFFFWISVVKYCFIPEHYWSSWPHDRNLRWFHYQRKRPLVAGADAALYCLLRTGGWLAAVQITVEWGVTHGLKGNRMFERRLSRVILGTARMLKILFPGVF